MSVYIFPEVLQPKNEITEINVGGSHLNTIFNDDPKKCFENAIKKNAFTGHRVTDRYDYIMYMCSNSEYDFFKTKITKTKYKVRR